MYLATALKDGAGRAVATVGGVEFYLNQARLMAVDAPPDLSSCSTMVWSRGSRWYHTAPGEVPPEVDARPLRDFLLMGTMAEVVAKLAGTWVEPAEDAEAMAELAAILGVEEMLDDIMDPPAETETASTSVITGWSTSPIVTMEPDPPEGEGQDVEGIDPDDDTKEADPE